MTAETLMMPCVPVCWADDEPDVEDEVHYEVHTEDRCKEVRYEDRCEQVRYIVVRTPFAEALKPLVNSLPGLVLINASLNLPTHPKTLPVFPFQLRHIQKYLNQHKMHDAIVFSGTAANIESVVRAVKQALDLPVYTAIDQIAFDNQYAIVTI